MPTFETVEHQETAQIIQLKAKLNIIEVKQEVNSRLQRAFVDGVLFGLGIGKMSWTTKLIPQDLGLEKFPDNVKGGRMFLLPEEKLGSISKIESQARRHLDINSLHFKVSARKEIRFVRKTHLVDVYEAIEKYEAEFWKAVDELIADYENMKLEMHKAFPQFKDKLDRHYIPASEIRAEYYFEYDLTEMSAPSDLKIASLKDAIHDQEDAERRQATLARIEADTRAKAEANVTKFVETTVRELRGEVVKVFGQLQEKIQSGEKLSKTNVDTMRGVIDRVKELDFLNDTSFHAQLDRVILRLEDQPRVEGKEMLEAVAKAMGEAVTFVAQTTEQAVTDLTENYFSRAIVLE